MGCWSELKFFASDVPLGRGGFVNGFPGHKRYLKMVQERQLEYVQCKKSEKAKVSSQKAIGAVKRETGYEN